MLLMSNAASLRRRNRDYRASEICHTIRFADRYSRLLPAALGKTNCEPPVSSGFYESDAAVAGSVAKSWDFVRCPL
jgi:hypothetical protein